mmetsp:Transcript_20912/g.33683  ORF Transcript_20912/g.33683 Transcript_20912/m.33683 type:complete len:239 (-) Transcript_20912:162-878(-)
MIDSVLFHFHFHHFFFEFFLLFDNGNGFFRLHDCCLENPSSIVLTNISKRVSSTQDVPREYFIEARNGTGTHRVGGSQLNAGVQSNLERERVWIAGNQNGGIQPDMSQRRNGNGKTRNRNHVGLSGSDASNGIVNIVGLFSNVQRHTRTVLVAGVDIDFHSNLVIEMRTIKGFEAFNDQGVRSRLSTSTFAWKFVRSNVAAHGPVVERLNRAILPEQPRLGSCGKTGKEHRNQQNRRE